MSNERLTLELQAVNLADNRVLSLLWQNVFHTEPRNQPGQRTLETDSHKTSAGFSQASLIADLLPDLLY